MGKAFYEDEPLWYKDAVIYELHVKSFNDSNDDGIGDFGGLIQKLDYLEELGVTAIWLLPFYPSPLKDDGYDISNYTDINPDYGTLEQFQEFLNQAHARGIKVITELVINHTSDAHEWFQRARRAAAGSVERNYYVWSDTPEKYQDARIIFTDFESSNWTFDHMANAYFWHRFYSHQPDLNFDTPAVQDEIFKVLDFWFEMGVDGMRLDAVPYLYERQGTNCENLPETYAFLKKLRVHVDSKYKNKMLLAEANQWPEDAVAYFGKGDMCHVAFHFPLMPRIFMALQMEDRFPIVDILEETPQIPEACQWAMFLRNHDELTLEMVTDEERDYMYRVYALDPRAKINLGIRRRLAPLLDNNRRKIECMSVLLFSLPGTPIIYYGDEIGMGDNFYLGDRNGVRTPMQWSPDRNAGFSRTNPQRLNLPVIIDPEYHYETVNVENQNRNLSSLLWWTKRVIAMRKRFKAFGRGDFKVLWTENPKILAFTRKYEDEIILVVMNLSRFSQATQFDLSEYADSIPREVFSQNKFPQIRTSPYTLTMAPHGYLWLQLQPAKAAVSVSEVSQHVSPIHVEVNWQSCLRGRYAVIMEDRIFPAYLMRSRWFRSKAKTIIRTKIIETIPFHIETELTAYIVILEISYTEGLPERYLLPISHAPRHLANELLKNSPEALIATVFVEDVEGVLYDSIYNENFRTALLNMISSSKRVRGTAGQFSGIATKDLRKEMYSLQPAELHSQLVRSEQSNSGIMYGSKYMLKIYRKLEEGTNPEIELESFLSEKTEFKNIPKYYGSIEIAMPGREPLLSGILQGFIENEGDGWSYTASSLGQFFEAVLAKPEVPDAVRTPIHILGEEAERIPKELEDMVGHLYLQLIGLLGKRTAQMHLALSSELTSQSMRPEPFTLLYQNSIYQTVRIGARRTMRLLESVMGQLEPGVRELGQKVLALGPKMLEQFQEIRKLKIAAMKIRIHGDYHLGQVLYTGKDFVIIDLEGEPARPLSERRLKRSAFRDVAGMVRSFHYAANSALLRHKSVRTEDIAVLEPWVDLWYHCVAAVFVKAYIDEMGPSKIIPSDKQERAILLHTFLLHKAIYELSYELNNRPNWVMIPLRGILHLVEGHENARH